MVDGTQGKGHEERADQLQEQKREHKQVTLSYPEGKVLPLDTKLHHAYTVWAMVKSQYPAQGQSED